MTSLVKVLGVVPLSTTLVTDWAERTTRMHLVPAVGRVGQVMVTLVDEAADCPVAV